MRFNAEQPWDGPCNDKSPSYMHLKATVETNTSVDDLKGIPVFTNKFSAEDVWIEDARGKVLNAKRINDDKASITIRINKDAFPHLCRGFEEGYFNNCVAQVNLEGLYPFINLATLTHENQHASIEVI